MSKLHDGVGSKRLQTLPLKMLVLLLNKNLHSDVLTVNSHVFRIVAALP